MYVVNRLGGEESPDERFIDVFRGGQLLTRSGLDPLFLMYLRKSQTKHRSLLPAALSVGRPARFSQVNAAGVAICPPAVPS